MLKGSIRQRGDKYQVIFPYKNEDGDWKQKSKTCSSLAQAKEILKGFNLDGDLIGDNPKMSRLAKDWISEVSLHGSENTIRTYKLNSQFIIERLGDKKINDITRQDIVKLYKTIKKDGFEIRAYKGCFNMMMNFAVKSKYITLNPGTGISTTRTNEKRSAKMFTHAERLNLINEAKGSHNYYLIKLLFLTGLRIGEALGLSWKEVDLKEGTIQVKKQYLTNNELTTKLKSKNSYRTIFLDSDTIDMLKELKTTPFSTFETIFSDIDALRGKLTRYLEKYDATPHDLRHNHGTDLLDICNLADAAYRMGHTVEEYVSTYVHHSDTGQREIAVKMNNPIYSLCDRFVTEGESKVINLADINGSR